MEFAEFTDMLSEEEKGCAEQRLVDEKLIEMTSKILNMRKKLDSVNVRFAYVRHELTDQHEYVVKLARIKEALEEQENILKRQVVEIAQRVLRRRCLPRQLRENTVDVTTSEPCICQPVLHGMDLQKCQKEKLNNMLKLKSEIENMREYEQHQTEKLNDLQRIKQVILQLSSFDERED